MAYTSYGGSATGFGCVNLLGFFLRPGASVFLVVLTSAHVGMPTITINSCNVSDC